MALAAAVVCDGWQPSGYQQRPVLGIPAGPYLELSPGSRAAFEQQCALLRDAGYTLRAVEVLANIDDVAERHRRLVAAEIAAVHAEWYAAYGTLYRPRTAALIREGQAIGAAALEAARAGRAELRGELEQAMRAAKIDLWIAPAAPGAAPRGLETTGDPRLNLPWTHAGMPVVSIPAASIGGLPLAVQLVAPFGADERLLAWAQELAAVLA